MKSVDLTRQTVPQLVDRFLGLALAKGDAVMAGQNAKVSRLYWALDGIEKELRSREGDQRRGLRALYDHPNPQVRLEAAQATLAVFPEAAKAALQMICDRDEFPPALDAGHTLLYIREGRYTPE